MTLVLLAGALVGAGVLLLVWLFAQAPVSGPVALAQFDARLAKGRRQHSLTRDRRHSGESPRMRKLGSDLHESLERRGITLPTALTAALGIVGQSRETFLARSVVSGFLGLFLPFVLLGPTMVVVGLSPAIPLWLCLIGVVVGALLPYLQLQRDAEERRRGFRHVVSSFLDLVAMNLSGGRGVPEALQSASAISDGWALVRIRDTLEAARLQGITPWAALGELGEELDVDELRDLSAALALVAEDGAKVRESLAARANSMRRRELADAEGRAAARSQSMLIAQLLLCVGFMLFLIYPAVVRIMG